MVEAAGPAGADQIRLKKKGKGKMREKKATIRVIVKEPGMAPEWRIIPNELEALQREVDGYIEVVRFAEDAAMIVNEEGKLRGLEPNFRFGIDMIVGTAILVGVDGEEFTDWPLGCGRGEAIFGEAADE